MKPRALAAAGLTAILAVGPLGAVHGSGVWSDPQVISPDSLNGSSPLVTSSADGSNLVAAWLSSDGVNSRVTATFSTNGGGTWDEGNTVNPPGLSASGLQLAGSGDGTRQVAVWKDSGPTPGGDFIQAAAYTQNTGPVLTPWANPVPLATPSAGETVGAPDVTVSATGQNVGVVYRQGPSNSSSGFFRRSADFGSTYSPPVLFAAGENQLQDLQVAGSSDGTRLAAVWVSDIGGRDVIRESRSSNSGASWSNPETISTFGQDAFSPALFMSGDGSRATAVWLRQPDSSQRLVDASQSVNGGNWSPPERISPAGQKAATPDLTGAADGSVATAVWVNETELLVQAAKATGSTWAGPSAVSPEGQGVFRPSVVAGDSGQRVTALWMRAGASQQILANDSLDGGASWGQTVSASASSPFANDPAVAASASGFRNAAVWVRSNGTNNLIEAGTYFEQQPQTITFAQPAGLTVGAGPSTLTATASSGLPVSLTTTSAACTVSGSQVTPVAVGDCVITARQAGDADFLPAPEVTRTVPVGAGPPRGPSPQPVSAQRIACSGTPPAKIKRRGTTTILPKNCRTDAGQVVSVSVSGKRKDLRKVQVKKKAGKTVLRGSGKKARVTLTYRAPATSGFQELQLVRRYRI